MYALVPLLARVDAAHWISLSARPPGRLATPPRASGCVNAMAEQPAALLAFIALRIHAALSQEMFLSGSCQCFLLFKSPPDLHTTAILFVVVVFCLFSLPGFHLPVRHLTFIPATLLKARRVGGYDAGSFLRHMHKEEETVLYVRKDAKKKKKSRHHASHELNQLECSSLFL